jgi:hypothetical protein
MSVRYANRHNIKPVLRNFARSASKTLLEEALYRVNTAGSGHATAGIEIVAKTACGLARASKQQGEEAMYTNTSA